MTSITHPVGIQLVQMRAQLGALNLEMKGMKRSGRSMSAMLKDHYGLPPRASLKTVHAKLLEEIEATEKEFLKQVSGDKEPQQ